MTSLFYHRLLWYPISALVFVALLSDLLWGSAVLMGWAHNYALLSLFALVLATKDGWKTLSTTDKSLTLAFLLGSVWIGTTWTTMASPWLFSTYALLALWTGWLAYLLGRAHPIAPTHLSLPGLVLGLCVVPAVFLLPWVWFTLDSDPTFDWLLNLTGFGNVRAVGHFVALGAGGLTAWIWAQHRPPQAGWWLVLALLWMVGFWSGSRTGMLAGVMGLILTAALLRPQLAMVGKALAVIALGFALSLPWPVPNNQFGMMNRIAVATTVLSTADTPAAVDTRPAIDAVSSGRIDLWKRGITSIQEAPWTGHGLANWRGDAHNNPQKSMFHLHNIVLDTLHSFGLILGGALLLLVGGACLRALWNARAMGLQASVPVVFIFVTSGLAMLDATFWMPLPALALGWSLGVLLPRQKA